MSASVQDVEQALAGLRTGYQTDGYDLLVDSMSDGVAKVRIAAGPEACVECLVPKGVAVSMIKATLKDVAGLKDVELEYPAEQAH